MRPLLPRSAGPAAAAAPAPSSAPPPFSSRPLSPATLLALTAAPPPAPAGGAGTAAGPPPVAPALAPAMSTRVVFVSPGARIAGEGKSKLLAVDSGLGAWLVQARALLRDAGAAFDARPPHIEVLRASGRDRAADEAAAKARAEALQGTVVPLALEVMGGKALVVPTGRVPGYGATHATVAYFRDGLTAADCARHAALLLAGGGGGGGSGAGARA